MRTARLLPARALAVIAALAGLLAPLAAGAPGTAGAAEPHAKPSADKRFDARTRTRLDRALRTSMAATRAPGVVAGVWVGDRGWTARRGSTRRGAAHRPVLDVHTRVGSVTKTFTGTLVLQLVDEGKLRLDDTIERWFADLPDARNITIRELGSMSSGIASYTLDPTIADRYLSRPTVPWKPSELIAGGAALPREFPPGQGFSYSNTNFVMLGQIIERVTKEPLDRVLRSKILRPLGLSETSYPKTSRLPKPYWRGYTTQGAKPGSVRDATSWSPTFASAAGQMISTLEDLRTWAHALGKGSLLERSTQRARLVPNPASAAGGREYLFALGRDHGWLAHDGDIPGYNTQIAYLPSLKATVVVMANADIEAPTGATPAPPIFRALARVIAPKRNTPAA